MKKKIRWMNVGLMLAMTLGSITTLFALPGERQVLASADPGVLAYVLPNDETGDEIHFINADGTGDKKIWSTGKPGVNLIQEIHSLTWKPDASEMAFVSRFQDDCSLNREDVYAVLANGTGLRRQTAPYGCGPNPGLPTGTVVLDVINYSGDGVFIVYVEGAPAPQSVPLASGESATLTFTDVMDYGDGVAQWAVGIVGVNRFMDITSLVDVIPGKTAYSTLRLVKYTPSWKSPTYSGDGKYMAYIASPNFAYYGPSPMTSPGGIGWYWQPDAKNMTNSPSHLQWIGDKPEQSELLYLGYKTIHDYSVYGYGFYRADHEGSRLLTEVPNPVFGMAVLPDGSGLIYSSPEDMGDWDIDHGGCVVQWVGNIYEYDFDSGETTQLSQFDPRPSTSEQFCPPGPFPYELTISPDGSKIAFEIQSEGNWTDATHSLDLWIMNRDGSDAHELVPGGQSPAWSPKPIPAFYTLNQVSPASAMAGGPSFTLQLTGAGFDPGAVVRWNDVNLTTVYVSGTRLDATVPAALIARAGTTSLSVYNATTGGYFSNTLTFRVNGSSQPMKVYLPFQVKR